MGGYVTVDVSVGCYKDIIPDGYFTYNRYIYANPNTIADDGCTFAFASIFLSYCEPLMDVAIVADFCCRVYSDAEWMSYV